LIFSWRVHEIVSYTQLKEVCVNIVKPNGEKCGEHAKDQVELKSCRSVCIKWMKCWWSIGNKL
jgi:hypothetical protein